MEEPGLDFVTKLKVFSFIADEEQLGDLDEVASKLAVRVVKGGATASASGGAASSSSRAAAKKASTPQSAKKKASSLVSSLFD